MTVSWLYLAGAAIGAWFTKSAIWPVELPKIRAIPSFFAGWLVNELVFHHFVWQAILSGVFISLGALEHWAGWVALALTALQWAGNAWIAKVDFAAHEATENALEEALGGDYRARLPDSEVPWEGIRWRSLVIPFWFRHPDVRRQGSFRYARVGARDLMLDVYRHRGHDDGDPRPVILYVHGGAWIIGRRSQQGMPLMLEMCSRGWVGVNASYRLSPWARFPEHLEDVKRMIAWIREHADEIGADPDFIAIAGGSAGGHLTALAALTADRPELQPGFEDADTSVQASLPFYGVYDFLDRNENMYDDWEDFIARHVMQADKDEDPDRYRLASPIDQIRPDAPPMMVVHGARDTLTPVADAREFVRLQREIGENPVVFVELPGAQHAFDVFPSVRTALVLRGVARFLGHAYAARRASVTTGTVTGRGGS